MAIYARVENGVVVERIDTGNYAINQLFAPSFVESMVLVPDDQQIEIGAPLDALPAADEPTLTAQNSRLLQTSTSAETESAPSARAWRQASLAATEWLVTRHRDEQALGRGTHLQAAQYLQLLEYRQALRDWPGSPGFPAMDSRPAVPQWLTHSID
ncbi:MULTISPECIES: phage tail assembly chaperone [unclassified Pseudomonas]|uniref:phage tail assembly chaperone n=1 Tax=unclassified Pseudomonas TaxID=196821 RepID=UPI00215CEB64|nr:MULTISPECIES: phage tail assembly chaperone [unclassified Pseudomonas]MCR8932743.1 phage tail assembly chaperone [Pseudomonas sp. S11A4]MCR8976347.1 phage tail assembly chaperone [Pseudomonas sp. S11P7]